MEGDRFWLGLRIFDWGLQGFSSSECRCSDRTGESEGSDGSYIGLGIFWDGCCSLVWFPKESERRAGSLGIRGFW